jgi:1,4-dihydroxy-2-naphthoate octaprenyltransferase
MGQLIDLDADRQGGKLGLAARRGTHITARLYVAVQLLLVVNVFVLGLFLVERGWPILLAALPYPLLLPGIWRIIVAENDNPDSLKPAAGRNVQLHLLFSFGLIMGLLLRVLIFVP